MQNEINAAGSPAARDFARLQMAQLRPEFAQQGDALSAQLAAQGLSTSGAGRALGGNVASNEASTLAGVTAPLYQQALQGYTDINAQMPGAQEQAYNDAIQQFYQALSGASQAAAGIPPNFGSGPSGGYGPAGQGSGSGGTGYYAPGDPGGVSNTPYMP